MSLACEECPFDVEASRKTDSLPEPDEEEDRFLLPFFFFFFFFFY